LVNAGDIQRSQAQEWVDNLVERSRKTSEQVLELVRHEVATQLDRIDGKSLEAIANQVAEILKKSAKAGRTATKDVTEQAGKTAKGVTQQASRTAKGVGTQASRTAKGVGTQAGKTAKGVTQQASKTAKRATAAAKKVTPTRRSTGKSTKNGPGKSSATHSTEKKSSAKKSDKDKSDKHKKAAS
jgi:hypothetical protein